MCQHAAETLGALLTAELPDIKELMTYANNYENTDAGKALLATLGQFGNDLSTWTPGDVSQDILTVANDALLGFQALTPFVPAQWETLAALANGALVVIVNTIKGNNAHATGDTVAAEAAHGNAMLAAGHAGYRVTPFTVAAIQLNPDHAASEYKKQSVKIHKQIEASIAGK